VSKGQDDLTAATQIARRALTDAFAVSGATLSDWRPRQVDHRPGRSTTMSFRVHVEWPNGRVTEETLCARMVPKSSTTKPPNPITEESTTSSDYGKYIPSRGMLDQRTELSDGTALMIWQFPADPFLPTLAPAVDTGFVKTLLRHFDNSYTNTESVAIKTLSYRPSRRAVIEIRCDDIPRLYLKSMRPGSLAEMSQRYHMLTDAGLPTPRILDARPDGLLVLQPLRGESMRSLVKNGAALPRAAELTGLLDRFPKAAMDLPARKPWSASARWYAQVIGAVLPDEASRAQQLAQEIGIHLADRTPQVPTHGDFYEAQVRVSNGRVTGLLDVDTLGPGRRAEDLGCLVAHLDVLSIVDTHIDSAIHQIAWEYATQFARTVDPQELRANIAGVMLSLATGPHRVQENGWQRATSRRLDAVEHWLETPLG
jgi:aminoglycoside phosphotransferase